MNKNKKIAMAAVSAVMAGTMIASLAACTPAPGREKADVSDMPISLKSDGTLDYSKYKRETPVTLNIGIGNNSAATSTSFRGLGAQITLADGINYEDGNMKPAWVQMGKDLNITWNDVYNGDSTSNNLKNLVAGTKDHKYADTDIFTTDLSKAVEYAAAGTDVLNLAEYLDLMPNFKNFLEANPVVYLSLLQEGMVTTGDNKGDGKILYVAPYFDGNDTIERYCIIRQDWADKILNGATTLATGAKYNEACYENADTKLTAPQASSYMGKTGTLKIESANKEGTGKVNIVKNYGNVLTQVKTGGSALDTAYQAIAGKAYDGDSGNIVDIMNEALKANMAATGDKLAELFRAYVDACYQTEAGAQYYAAGERSNLFNGYDACWDVDDLVAMLRCVKTNAPSLLDSELSNKIDGIVARDGTIDRTPDIVRLAAQLYGVRGGDSRYEYTYIDDDGTLQDARNDKEFYEAMNRLHTLRAEGLVSDYSGLNAYKYATAFKAESAKGKKDGQEAFMLYDYNQTQTLNGFFAEDTTNLTGLDLPEGYNFAPVVTPVSKWDVDGDGDHTDIMRFTESWRSTKTSGIALNGELAYNRDKLIAALQFVDYLYSEDGQIVSTFGPRAENAEGKNGFWYDEEATAAEVEKGAYYTYKGVKYSGFDFDGATPTITTKLYDQFRGLKVNGYALTDKDSTKNAARSFTNYARMLIGSTLPMGVKSQSFENQLTSVMGQTGAKKVGVGLDLGTIKGLTLEIDENNWWYTCVPTGVPIESSIVSGTINNSNMNRFKYLSGEKASDSKNIYSIFTHVILFGTSGTYNQQDQSYTVTSIDALLTEMKDTCRGQIRENAMNGGWTTAKAYWEILKPAG